MVASLELHHETQSETLFKTDIFEISALFQLVLSFFKIFSDFPDSSPPHLRSKKGLEVVKGDQIVDRYTNDDQI